MESQPNFLNKQFTDERKKVVYGFLTHNLSGLAQGGYNLEISLIDKPGMFPIYFLPWESRTIIHMTIPKKGQGDPNVEDPDIFFTAGINGCSVFFKGTAESPTVYHGGIDSTMHGALQTNSGKFWRDLLLENEGNLVDPGTHEKKFGEVKASQYVNMNSKKVLGQDPTDQNKTETSKLFEAFLKNKNKKELDIKAVMPWGCVFGLRNKLGFWTFYLQENAKITYIKLKKKAVANPNARDPQESKPMRLMQVFPGRDHVQIRGFRNIR